MHEHASVLRLINSTDESKDDDASERQKTSFRTYVHVMVGVCLH